MAKNSKTFIAENRSFKEHFKKKKKKISIWKLVFNKLSVSDPV